MNIHEYQAKDLFRANTIPTNNGKVTDNPTDARKIAEELGGSVWAVKAQIHAGGRGKGGGVKIAKSLDEVEAHAKAILGMQLVTPQTGAEGKLVRKVLVEAGAAIVKEYYLGITLDRAKSQNSIIASTEGGMSIEEIAEHSPEKIFTMAVNPVVDLMPNQVRELGFNLGLSPDKMKAFSLFVTNLYKFFVKYDCSLAEINPLIETASGEFLALDAKINFDDNALFRHADVVEMRDLFEEDPLEVEASKSDLNYIKLDGSIGCMVNGAGLAMATMDIIKLSGGTPANFLDVGGGTNVERVAQAFKLLISDPNVKTVFVNIFGGIVRCDRVAQGIIEALKTVEVKVPIAIRLEGTNASEAMELLKNSGMQFTIVEGLAKAAEVAVQLASA
jgi:succinyl-CoA synthetase beta subunit